MPGRGLATLPSQGATRWGQCPTPGAAATGRGCCLACPASKSSAAEKQEQPLVDRGFLPPAGPPAARCFLRCGKVLLVPEPRWGRWESSWKQVTGGRGGWSQSSKEGLLLAGLDVVQHKGLLATAGRNRTPRGLCQQSWGRTEPPRQLSWWVLAGSAVHPWEQGRVCSP